MTAVIRSELGDVALLTLDRPESLNAINARTVRELGQALDVVEGDDSVAVVITGAGRAFCAGADLKEPAEERPHRAAEMHQLVLRLSTFPKVSVAALNGLAYGGGLELAMACTLRVCVPDTRLALPEARLFKGLPSFGGTQLLPRLVGRAHALEMLLTGDPITAERAHSIGLVNLLAEDSVAAAAQLAERASVAGALTINLIRQVVEQGPRLDLAEALVLESEATRQVRESGITAAGIAAFANRKSDSRSPVRVADERR